MTEKRFIRNIGGQVYDTENDKFYHEDYVGKPLSYEDEVIILLNDQHKEIQYLRQLLNIGKTNAKDLIDVLNDQEQEKARLQDELKNLRRLANELYMEGSE